MEITYEYKILKVHTVSTEITPKTDISFNNLIDQFNWYVKNTQQVDESTKQFSQKIKEESDKEIKNIKSKFLEVLEQSGLVFTSKFVESETKNYISSLKSSFETYNNSLNGVPSEVKQYYYDSFASKVDALSEEIKNSIKLNISSRINSEIKKNINHFIDNNFSSKILPDELLLNILTNSLPNKLVVINNHIGNKAIFDESLQKITQKPIKVSKYIYKVEWERTGTDELGNVGSILNSTSFLFFDVDSFIEYDKITEKDIISWLENSNGNSSDSVILQQILEQRNDTEKHEQFPWSTTN